MLKKVLHSIFILVMVLAVPLGNIMAKPIGTVVLEKKQCTSASKKAEEPVKELVQPQVVHVHATYVHAPSLCILEHQNIIGFSTADPFAIAIEAKAVQLSASKFFKTLFRHYIATQAP